MDIGFCEMATRFLVTSSRAIKQLIYYLLRYLVTELVVLSTICRSHGPLPRTDLNAIVR